MRRRGHQDPAAPGHDAVGKRDVVGEDRLVFIAAAAVPVFEDADAALEGLARRRAVGIVAHLDDPELAVFVEGHGHGTFQVRLGGDQFDPQPGSHAELPEGLLGGKRATDLCGFLRRLCGLREPECRDGEGGREEKS